MQTKTVKSTDLKKLKSFVVEKALDCLHAPEGMLNHRYITPTYGIIPGADDSAEVPERSTVGHYLQMYDWDSCLFSQAQTHLGLTNLATDVVSNFLELRHPNGYVPRTISPYRIWDGADHCKPLLCQALLKEQQDSEFKTPIGKRLLSSLNHFLTYFQNNRFNAPTGLYHWRNMLESGVDDNYALIYPLEASKDENEEVHGFPDSRLLAVDINSWLVLEFAALSELATVYGADDLKKQYALLSKKLSEKIEDYLWDEELSIYCNFDPVTRNHVRMRTWTGLLPIALGIAKPERAEKTLKQCIMNPEHFFRPAGISSVAASEGLYNQARRGLYGRAIVANWQGPVWVLPSALLVRGLLKYGYEKEATEIALRITNTLVNGVNTIGTLNENYNAETGEPLWAPHFISWNILSLEMIQLLE